MVCFDQPSPDQFHPQDIAKAMNSAIVCPSLSPSFRPPSAAAAMPRRAGRSFTAPVAEGITAASMQHGPDFVRSAGGVEVLFAHPRGRVVAFSPMSSPQASAAPGQNNWTSHKQPKAKVASAETNGSLPWSSPTERTIAAGEIALARAHVPLALASSLERILSRVSCHVIQGFSLSG